MESLRHGPTFFSAGSLITGRLAHIDPVKADSNRVFELRVYYTLPGKVLELEDSSWGLRSHRRNCGRMVSNSEVNCARLVAWKVSAPSDGFTFWRVLRLLRWPDQHFAYE
jgi:hypothetical protein